jgi:FkbM family methyltransferase
MTFASATLFKLLERVEGLAARAQGKGYETSMAREVELLRSVVPRAPSLALDIGGNVGEYTAQLRKVAPQVEIHTFEPAATNVAKLRQRFQYDPNVHIVPLALSDQEGETTLFSDRLGSGMASLTQRKLDHYNISFDRTEAIRAIRFEDYWKQELKERPIDIVKVDIEGHELSALRGFGAALKNTCAIQFEFGGTDIDTRVYFRDFWYFFKERDFRILRITPFGLQDIPKYSEINEAFVFTNYIAVKRS